MTEGFVDAYSKRTGKVQPIPEHWVGDPVLGAGFEVTPSAREQRRVDDGPSLDWTAEQLRDHADSLGVDRTGLRSKADVLAAIEAHLEAVTPGSSTTAPVSEPGVGSGETPIQTPDDDAGQGDDADGTTTTDTPGAGDDTTQE